MQVFNRLRNKLKVADQCYLSAFVTGAVGNLLGPLIPILSTDFRVSYKYIGFVFALGNLAYLLAIILTGASFYLVTKHKLISAGLAVSLISSAAIIFIKTPLVFVLSVLFLELGRGVIINSATAMLPSLFPSEQAVAMNKLTAFISAGKTVSPLIISLILFIGVNWRISYVPFVVVYLFLLSNFQRRESREQELVVDTERKSEGIRFKGIVLLIFLIVFFYFGMVTFSTWLTAYFTSFGINTAISAIIVAFFSFSIVVGRIVNSKLLRKYKATTVALISAILSTLNLFAIVLIPNPIAKLALSATFGFSQAFIWPVMLAISIQTNPHISDRLSSAMLALAFISAMIFQPIAGAISDEWGASSCIYLPIASALVLLISVPILCALIRKTELSSGPFQISKNSASS